MTGTFKAGVAAIGVASMVALNLPPAAAVPVVTGEIAAAMDPAHINVNRQVDLTIAKVVNDGGVTPVKGVRFRVIRLPGFDVTKKADWQRLREMDIDDANRLALGAPFYEATTNAAGKAVFHGIPVGFYLVKEVVPADVPKDYRAVVDFVTLLPLADEDTGTWRYRVTITPKTEPIGSTKPKNPEPKPTPTRPVGSSVIPFLPFIPVLFFFPPGPRVNPGPTPTPSIPSPKPSPTEPAKPKGPEKGIPKIPLAQTGANVVGLLAIAVIIIVVGGLIVALKRRRREDQSHDTTGPA